MDKIKLIGIKGGQNYEAWRPRVQKALDRLKLSDQFEEINNIDVMLSLGLEAAPALIWGDTILLEQNGHIPDEEEITSSIIDYLEKNKLNMKNILVPTDFSKAALNAYRYALEIAEYTKSNIKLGHVCYPSTDSINGVSVPNIDDLVVYKKQQLSDFFEEEKTASNDDVAIHSNVEQEVILGFPKEELIKRSKDGSTDLIVMGTTGSGGVFNQFFGSVSSDVSREADCPVWLIPPNATFKGIKNILYAGNYQSADEETLNEISRFSTLFDAKIHMVNVTSEKSFKENQLQELVLERLFKKIAPDVDFDMHTVISERVWEGLDFYARENGIDLIVIATKHRGFWENLRHRSISKDVIFHTKTPLLITHLK